MTKKAIILITIIVCLAVAALLIYRPDKTLNQQETTIGAILPLTGDAAVYGEAIKNGIELALEEANTTPGGVRFRVVYEDDEGKNTAAVTAAQKLLAQDKPAAVIGGVMSSTCSAIGPIFQDRETVLVSPTATAPSLGKLGDFVFKLWPTDTFDGKVMAQYSFNELSLRRVGILFINLEYGVGVSNIFRKEFEKLGGKIVAFERYDQGETDFRAQLTKIKGLNPDGLFLPGYYKEISGIFRHSILGCQWIL